MCMYYVYIYIYIYIYRCTYEEPDDRDGMNKLCELCSTTSDMGLSKNGAAYGLPPAMSTGEMIIVGLGLPVLRGKKTYVAYFMLSTCERM